MATVDPGIADLHLGCRPTPSDNTDPAIWQPASVLGTNDIAVPNEWIFGGNNAAQPTTKISIHGQRRIPSNYVGTAVVVIVWTATVTSGNVVWDFDYRTVAGDNTTSLDQATWEESVTVTDAAPGATDRRLQTTINLTSANLAAGETLLYAISRDGADAADTMAGSARLREVHLKFDDA